MYGSDRQRLSARYTIVPILTLWLTAALGAASPLASQDRGGYVIESFDTEIVVEEDSDMLVQERIVVNFSEPRHGIYRTVPVRYSDPRGYAYSLDLRLLEVRDDDGREYQVRSRDQGRYVNIRIGDPDRTVTGRTVYVLRYRVRDALSRFGEFDEIYWNATGHEWNAPIRRARATVRLPAAIDPESLMTAGYTGAAGETERAVEITYPEPGVVHFAATRSFAPLEGLTVAVGFPPGVVTFPSPAQRLARLATDNWVLLLPFAWLGFLVRRHRQHGRDADPGASIMVAYEPPPGLTPGGVGTLIDERVDIADITATVVDLAVRRHLTIRSDARQLLFGLIKQEEITFKREPTDGSERLLPHEKLVMKALFEAGDEVSTSDLTNRFYKHLPGIRRALYDRLAEEEYFDGSPEKVRQRWTLFGLIATFAVAVISFGWTLLRGIGPPAMPLVPLIAAGLTFALSAAMASVMPRRTPSGAAARRWALGFQEFTRRVEGERLERAATDPRHEFESLLPFAMALGVAGDWAKRYEGIYARTEPDWYVGPHVGRGFSTSAFEESLSSAMSRAGSTMSSSPRSSSGSGGGGSSGGGGGGGGGGSW